MQSQSQPVALGSIRAVMFSSLGVIFSEKVLYTEDGKELRARSHHDGLGINILREEVHVAWITGESTSALDPLGKKFNSPGRKGTKSENLPPITIITGSDGKDKKAAFLKWLDSIGVPVAEAAFMGHDRGDIDAMQAAGISAAPSSAADVVLKMAHFVSTKRGGDGAIREFCEAVLAAKGIDLMSLIG